MRGKPPVKKILSPIQRSDLGGSVDSVIRLVGELSILKQELISSHDEKINEIDSVIGRLENKIDELDSKVLKVKNLHKGDPGVDADEQKIADYVLSEIRDWVLNQIVPQIRQPKDGVSPDANEIARKVLSQIPKVDAKQIESRILAKVPKADLKVIQRNLTSDPMSVITKILELAKDGKFKLPKEGIDGLDQTVSAMWNQIGKRGYLHGGGDTVEAGTNITITSTTNGKKRISASSTSFSVLAATGTIDDSNVTFTFVSVPTLISINGSMYSSTSTVGSVLVWTNVGTTVTLAFPVGSGGSIYGLS